MLDVAQVQDAAEQEKYKEVKRKWWFLTISLLLGFPSLNQVSFDMYFQILFSNARRLEECCNALSSTLNNPISEKDVKDVFQSARPRNV